MQNDTEPRPATTIPAKVLGLLDYLIVNSIEIREIAKKLGLRDENNAAKIAHALAVGGKMTCIVTLGKSGAIAVTKDGNAIGVPTIPIDQKDVVDVNGAGDAFCGTFAAALHAGKPLSEAMRRSTVAASLCCLKQGALPSLPYSAEIEEKLSLAPEAQPVKI